jgi:alpha-beta hydrolase superfamily lysophospholipase
MTDYAEELVHVAAADGTELGGALIRPVGRPARPAVVVWLHGSGLRFYAPPFVAIGRELARRGYVFVTGNTRGHDIGVALRTAAGAVALGGAGWERAEDLPLDVAAWTDLAAARGAGAVVLVGHSSGASNVALYQAAHQDGRVVGIGIASSRTVLRPPRPLEEALVTQAAQLVADGRGEELLPWGSVPAGGYLLPTLSAQTYLSRAQTYPVLYGDVTRLPALAQLRGPLFACIGTADGPDPAGWLDAVRAGATSAARVDTWLLAGAGHGYRGHEAAAAAPIADWLDRL